MNIAFFLKPKISLSFIYSDFTMRQAMEKMRRCGYTAVPVIGRDGKYAGTVSEGDFLWFFSDCLKNNSELSQKMLEEIPVQRIMRREAYKPVSVTANVDELLNVSLNQNFVPVVDDLGSFIGIVTRRDIIKHLISEQ